MKTTEEKILDTLKEIEKDLKNIEKRMKLQQNRFIRETVYVGEPYEPNKINLGNHQAQ